MKRFFLYSFVVLSVLALGTYTIFAQDTSSELTEIPTSQVVSSNQEDDFPSIDEIRQDVYDQIYDDVYQDVYQEIVQSINDELYQDLYSQIELGFYEQYDNFSILNDLTQNQIYDVVEIANKSVFGIESYQDETGYSLGSGVIYKYDEIDDLYYIVTNNHVIEDGNNYKIRFEDETAIQANLLMVNEEADIALLSFSGSGIEGLQVAVLGSSSLLTKGEVLIAAGNPKGFNFYNSITLGIVAGLDRVVDGETITYIQHDAAINSGNSGGPIFNLDGEVVGINVLKYASEEIEGMGFSIPIDLVKDLINDYEN